MIEGLHAIVGSEGIVPPEPVYCLDGRVPLTMVAPASEEETASLVAYAYETRSPFVVSGCATALSAVRPSHEAWWLLNTRRLRGVVDYSPEDLVITVRAGTTLAEVQSFLKAHGQYLPWNVPLPERATIGGIVAGNRSGSWRYRHGTPRDRLLQVRAIRGDGVAFRSGAKVVKSVAGYDMHRLLCGSWGTLSVLTEVTLKVAPLPPVFEAVGWLCDWDQLEPTLAELMCAPLQPDGLSVWVQPTDSTEPFPTIYHQSIVLLPHPTGQPYQSLQPTSASSPVSVLEPPPPIVYEPAEEVLPETEMEASLQTARGQLKPYVLLEFSGRPAGVQGQLEWLRAHGYPVEPVAHEWLATLQNLLSPCAHRFMLQLLMRPNEIAEAMLQWGRPGISMLAHAGSGVLYLWGESEAPLPFLLERLRHTAFRWRVLRIPAEARADLPLLPLSPGERTLMNALKHAFDPAGLMGSIL